MQHPDVSDVWSLHSVLAASVSADHLNLTKGSNAQRNRKLEASLGELLLLAAGIRNYSQNSECDTCATV